MGGGGLELKLCETAAPQLRTYFSPGAVAVRDATNFSCACIGTVGGVFVELFSQSTLHVFVSRVP